MSQRIPIDTVTLTVLLFTTLCPVINSQDIEGSVQTTPKPTKNIFGSILRTVSRGARNLAHKGVAHVSERLGVGHLVRSDQRIDNFGSEDKFQAQDGDQSEARNQINRQQWEEHPAGGLIKQIN